MPWTRKSNSGLTPSQRAKTPTRLKDGGFEKAGASTATHQGQLSQRLYTHRPTAASTLNGRNYSVTVTAL